MESVRQAALVVATEDDGGALSSHQRLQESSGLAPDTAETAPSLGEEKTIVCQFVC